MRSVSCKLMRKVPNRSSITAATFHHISVAGISKLYHIPTSPAPTDSTIIDDLDLVEMNVTDIFLESYDAEFVKLRQEVEAINVFIPNAISFYGWKNYAALAIEKRTDVLSQRIDVVTADLRKFCDQINNASNDNFNVLIDTVTAMQHELDKEKIDKAAIQKYLDEQSNRLEQMQKQLNSFKIAVKKTQSTLNDTERDLVDIKEQQQALKQELESKETQLNDQELTNNALQTDVEYLTTLKETLENEKESTQNKHEIHVVLCFIVTAMIGLWMHWRIEKQSDAEKKKMISVHDEEMRLKNEEIRELQEEIIEVKNNTGNWNFVKSIGRWISGWL